MGKSLAISRASSTQLDVYVQGGKGKKLDLAGLERSTVDRLALCGDGKTYWLGKHSGPIWFFREK